MASVITYYVNASMPYAFYTIAIWAIGYIIYKLDNLKIYEINSEVKSVQEDIDLERMEQNLYSFVDRLRKYE